MAFSFGVWTPQPWSGKLPSKLKAESATLAIASSGGGRFDVMKSGLETGPIDADFDVAAYGKLEVITKQNPVMGEISLRARKIEGMAQIAEEDLVEGRNYNVDIVAGLRDRGTTNTALYFDNSTLATSGDASVGETGIVRPYRSVYMAVKTDSGSNYSTVANAATTAALRTAVKGVIEVAENSDYAEDIVLVAHPFWKTNLRDMPVDGSNGKPIWDEAANTILGYPVFWSRGARLSGTTATSRPTGNPLFVSGPRQMFITGRAPFTTGTPSTPEVFLSDPKTGIGMENDSAYFKMRVRLAFQVGVPSAFGVLERT